MVDIYSKFDVIVSCCLSGSTYAFVYGHFSACQLKCVFNLKAFVMLEPSSREDVQQPGCDGD